MTDVATKHHVLFDGLGLSAEFQLMDSTAMKFTLLWMVDGGSL